MKVPNFSHVLLISFILFSKLPVCFIALIYDSIFLFKYWKHLPFGAKTYLIKISLFVFWLLCLFLIIIKKYRVEYRTCIYKTHFLLIGSAPAVDTIITELKRSSRLLFKHANNLNLKLQISLNKQSHLVCFSFTYYLQHVLAQHIHCFLIYEALFFVFAFLRCKFSPIVSFSIIHVWLLTLNRLQSCHQ